MLNRPRRSVLFMPGINQRAQEKAKTLAADVLVLDLEDSVAPEKKLQARAQVLATVQAGGFGHREMVVRVNSLRSKWGEEDVVAMAHSGAAAICLPKVESAEEVVAVLAVLDAAAAPQSMAVWAMIETPLGVMNVDAIAASDQRLAVIAMGTTDLAKELRVPHTPDRLGLQYALQRCVLAARVYQKEILDGVFLDLDDVDGFRDVCVQGRELGFDGKTLIHPNQLAISNEIFAPSASELDRSHRLMAAWQQAEVEGKGVVVVDGKLVEGMHIDEARRNLALAESIEKLRQD